MKLSKFLSKYPADGRKVFVQVVTRAPSRDWTDEIVAGPWFDAPPTWVADHVANGPVGAGEWVSGTTDIIRVR
jgi:hypothetical protein